MSTVPVMFQGATRIGTTDGSADRTVVVIPARGGSKGIVGKNLQRVGGVPLVVRAVTTARSARLVDRVVVSTDDPLIADLAARHGAMVVDRPPSLSDDQATSESAVLHALDVLAIDGIAPEIIVLMQCTSPFTRPTDLDAVIAVVAAGTDCAFTAVPHHSFVWTRSSGRAAGVNHDPTVRLRRQDLVPEFKETGAAYAMRASEFARTGHRFFGEIAIVETDPARSLEIDDPHDLEVARRCATLFDSAYHGPLPAQVEALVLDFDGVLTDDTVITFEDGREAVVSSRRDGMGLSLLRRAAPCLPIVVISSEENPVVRARCRKLGIEVHQAVTDKIGVLRSWSERMNVRLDNTVYVGNDVNDLDCLRAVGCAVAPRDAHPSVLDVADVVLDADGGFGAVRALAERLIDHLGPRVPDDSRKVQYA